MKKSLTAYRFMAIMAKEASCENCEYYKNGHCEKYNMDSDPEALCSKHVAKTE